MITRALCRLRRTDGLRTMETELYDSSGLAVGNEYDLNFDGERTEWTITKIIVERREEKKE
jgi:hypothetical protein